MAKHVSYTVRAVQRETTRYQGGGVALEKGATIYLGFDPSGGGYPQWFNDMPQRTPYMSALDAIKTALAMDGMPWWNRPDMSTLQAVRLTVAEEFSAEDV